LDNASLNGTSNTATIMNTIPLSGVPTLGRGADELLAVMGIKNQRKRRQP
jgi:hypothetical protein